MLQSSPYSMVLSNDTSVHRISFNFILAFKFFFRKNLTEMHLYSNYDHSSTHASASTHHQLKSRDG